MAVVMTILGIIAGIAVPSLVPLLGSSRLHAETESVAGFLEQARRLAVNEGRCVRVVPVLGGLRIQRRTVGDCFNIDVETNAWATITEYFPPTGVTLTMAGQSLTTPASQVNDNHRIIFRPNGRLWGDGDLVVTDDGARINMTSSVGGANRRSVVISAVGRICTQGYGATPFPPLTIGNLGCP
jgi:Tfp pilus assembly protein FimT